jgi:AhpC/TSA family
LILAHDLGCGRPQEARVNLLEKVSRLLNAYAKAILASDSWLLTSIPCSGSIKGRSVDSFVQNPGGPIVKEGDQAPSFSVLDDQGKTVNLSDFAGKKEVVLFFFPKADTPG